MAKESFYFVVTLLLATFSFVPGIQGGFFKQYPSSADNQIDIGAILNRLDQIDLRDHNQQIVIDQLTKKNKELERKLESILLNHPEDGDHKLRQNTAIAAGNGKDFLPRSCYELKATNPNAQSGFYFIDPDGQVNGDDPVQAYCDMDTRTTSIVHDTEVKTDVTNCDDPGCYSKQIKYNATLRQMAMLADISGSCQQYFRFDSLSVPLEFDSIQYGFWNDRNGAKQIFWAGPANSNHTCQCGLENPNRCIDTRHNCNADSLAPIELVDEGYITASELLPVTRLSFGRTNMIGVKASYTLGRFQCTGQATVSNKPENCRTLFQMGHTLSGFYLVKSGGTKIATTYCDFSKGSSEVGYETRIGNVDVISSPVQFYVQRSTNWNTLNTLIPFQIERLNVGNAMNIETGVFKAPKAGTYSFAFSATKTDTTSNTYSFLRLNGNNIGIHYNGYTGALLSGSMVATLKLKVGDEITLVLGGGVLLDDANHHTQFSGILIEEDLAIL